MTDKSMLDIAYEVVKKANGPVPFATIWAEVAQELQFDEEQVQKKISVFYTMLSLDARFHNMGDNTWDLSSNLTFDQVNADIDFSLQESDDEVADEEEEEDEIINDEENDESIENDDDADDEVVEEEEI